MEFRKKLDNYNKQVGLLDQEVAAQPSLARQKEKRVAQPKVCVHYDAKRVKSLGFYRVFLFQINAHDAIGYVENEMKKFCSELQLKEKSNHIIQKTIKLFLLLKNEEKLQTPLAPVFSSKTSFLRFF